MKLPLFWGWLKSNENERAERYVCVGGVGAILSYINYVTSLFWYYYEPSYGLLSIKPLHWDFMAKWSLLLWHSFVSQQIYHRLSQTQAAAWKWRENMYFLSEHIGIFPSLWKEGVGMDVRSLGEYKLA